MDCPVVCNVIAIVAQRRGKEWHEPDRADPQLLKIIELLFKPLEVTDPIPIAILEGTDVHLIDDRVFVPEGILVEWQTAFSWRISSPLDTAVQNASLYEVTVIESSKFALDYKARHPNNRQFVPSAPSRQNENLNPQFWTENFGGPSFGSEDIFLGLVRLREPHANPRRPMGGSITGACQQSDPTLSLSTPRSPIVSL